MGFSSEKEAVNDFWGWPSDESNKEAIEASIRKYASAIADTVNKYGYDGFDIDYEPNFGNPGNIVDEDDRMFAFVDELGKYFGPKSGTGKLLVIDGEPQSITGRPEVGLYFDYFIIQAYNNSSPGSDSKLDKRLITGGVAGAGLVQTYSSVMSEEQITKMTIMTENFEATDAAMDGGYDYTDRYGNKNENLLKEWHAGNQVTDSVKVVQEPIIWKQSMELHQKYKNIRRAIQIMNPSSHSLLKKLNVNYETYELI